MPGLYPALAVGGRARSTQDRARANVAAPPSVARNHRAGRAQSGTPRARLSYARQARRERRPHRALCTRLARARRHPSLSCARPGDRARARRAAIAALRRAGSVARRRFARGSERRRFRGRRARDPHRTRASQRSAGADRAHLIARAWRARGGAQPARTRRAHPPRSRAARDQRRPFSPGPAGSKRAVSTRHPRQLRAGASGPGSGPQHAPGRGSRAVARRP